MGILELKNHGQAGDTSEAESVRERERERDIRGFIMSTKNTFLTTVSAGTCSV